MPTPQSNIEQYLSVIAGHSTEIPSEPSSRVEWYLYEIVKQGGIGGKLKPKPVSALPATGEPGILYLVPIQGTSGQNTHDEYFWVEEESKYELLGQAKIEIDLSNYALKSEIPTVPTNISAFENDSGYLTNHQDISGKVDKVTGKGLSTNDFTDALKDKLSGIESGATATAIDAALSNSGQAADAKATGDALDVLRTENALLRELLQGVDAPIYRDASGNPATFDDGAAANVKSLSVEIVPLQSGSGDPYPPGSGKNLLNITEESKTSSGVEFTVNRDSSGNPLSVSVNGTSTNTETIYFNVGLFTTTAGVSYTLTGCPAGGSAGTFRLSWKFMGYEYGDGLTVTGDGTLHWVTIEVLPGATLTNQVFYPMIRLASDTDPTFMPYSNIRAISGATSVTVTRTGENGANSQNVTVSLVDSNGEPMTVYGGTLDVTTGELTVSAVSVTIDGNAAGSVSAASVTDQLGGKRIVTNIGNAQKFAQNELSEYLLSDRLKPVSGGRLYGTGDSANQVAINDAGYIVLRYMGASTLSEAVAALNADPVQVVYPLAEPVMYQLTPAQLETLSGYNAVSTDAETVTVEYQSNYGGAKALTLTGIAASSPVGEQHRMIFGGRNLGSSVTPAQLAAVRDGSFHGLLTGDYWVINGVTWRIADMDYWYGCGETPFHRHHLVIMPDSNLAAAPMNNTDTTATGYSGSKMYTDTLPTVKTTCAAAFPDMILQHRELLVHSFANGKPSGIGWADADVELPTEIMMFGTRVMTPGNDGLSAAELFTIGKQQLALFSLAPRFIKPSAWWSWFRDPVNASVFSRVDSYGNASIASATSNGGVRPVFPIG